MRAPEPNVTKIAEGAYRVEIDGRAEIVYVAGPVGQRWAWARGRVVREAGEASRTRPAAAAGPQSIRAPMPAKVVTVMAAPGTRVSAGDTLVVIEAMKMEWPLRAESSGTVAAVHCSPGQLVQADAVLVDLVS